MRAKTLDQKAQVQCSQKPSWEAGSRTTRCSCSATDRAGSPPDCSARSGCGALRRIAATTRAITAETAAAEAKAGVQPAAPSTAANGIALRIWPDWPRMPMDWLRSGTRAGLNHAGSMRRIGPNVSASPAPTKMRPMMAEPMLVLSARSTWPMHMSTAPVASTVRVPSRSARMPAGICRPA